MMLTQLPRGRWLTRLAMLLLLTSGFPLVGSQSGLAQETQTDEQRAFDLFEKSNFAEALPILEKIAKNGEHPAVLSRLGFALFATAITNKDKAERQKQLDRARKILLRSQELGDDSNLTRTTLESLSMPESSFNAFSAIKDAESAIRAGEQAYVRGELDKALAAYERALSLDPKLYEAALFAGDMYFKKGYGATDNKTKHEWLEKAGEWFARAIQIDPNRETAYRYWGDALMLEKKTTEARNKFVEAIVAEPYIQRTYVGLTQWAEQVKIGLEHPAIKQPPTTPSRTTGKDEPITIDPNTLNPKLQGENHWRLYGLVRSTYPTAGFAKDHPKETRYRHSLMEEASALTVVAEAASKEQNKGNLNDESLDNLIKLWRAGMIEAYVLFARANEAIAADYAAYRKDHREKLRQYWLDFVIREK